MKQVFLGQIVHSKSLEELELYVDGFLAVSDGKIEAIGDRSQLSSLLPEAAQYAKVELSPSQFLLPGLIDCHIHAPQVPNIGLGLDKPLLEWLESYTFPLESNYRDAAFAERVYKYVVNNTIAHGTTTACYFASLYTETNKILVDEMLRQGQRGFVGKVSSNRMCPDFYIESCTEKSVEDNVDFIRYVMAKESDLVRPIVTPRFAITCDDKLMRALASLAEQYELNVQTHVSENLGEIETVKQQFPSAPHYVGVYDEVGLLTGKTVLAHGVHLEDAELEMLAARGTSIAHCPSSNTNLGSGFCDVRRLLEARVKVGLGTDVSGGSDMSILAAMRAALGVSQHLNFMKTQNVKGTGRVEARSDGKGKPYTPFSYNQVLYLATLGGAQALALDGKVGNFVAGKQFDALLIDTEPQPIGGYRLPEALAKEKSKTQLLLELVQKFVYVGDDRNILKVFVAGKQIKQ
ncbi:AGAP005282-PA-like protein [Anopheles sinensis]|uniref:Guanine deaminase n=1 Tax=Anopheles sinensis TaxID=74873 RepID=A0A084VXK2_ANOSI|nr:AGAP005282-PA-like protein [Anopheles sinensis]